jgi:hypothetical protein
VGRDVRLAADEQGRDDLKQLPPVDRAAVQLEVDVHVRRDRGRRGQRGDGPCSSAAASSSAIAASRKVASADTS